MSPDAITGGSPGIRRDLTDKKDDGAGKDFKERLAQRTEFRVLPYIIKPPFPSDGGCAAASAGRSGLRPSVGHVGGLRRRPVTVALTPRAPAGSR